MTEEQSSEENYVLEDTGKSWHGVSFASFAFLLFFETFRNKRKEK